MSRALKLNIDPSAIKHNLNHIKRLVPSQKILAMVKADAYGHRLSNVLESLKQADGFGVACLEEAIALRCLADKTQPIFLMEGIFTPQEIETALQLNCICVIHCQEQLQWLIDLAKTIAIWVKVDTGMNRLGFDPTVLPDVLEKIKNTKHINLLGVMSHFSDADNVVNPKTSNQIALFDDLQTKYFNSKSIATSLANSAGVFAYPEAHKDWVRPGLALYGVSPFIGKTGVDHGLLPAMSLTTEIIAISEVRKGEQIGYSSKHVCEKDTLVGIAAVGYGDGYPRNVASTMPVLVKNTKTRVLGNVSMDMMAVDLTPVDNPAIGDDVTLWGENLPVEELACCLGTIPYELLLHVRERGL